MFDEYTRRARLAPVLIAMVPALVLLAAAAFSPQDSVRIGGGVLAAIGLVACGLVRDRGRHLQVSLWESWGGSPTTQPLRLREAEDERATLRLRARVEAVLGGPLPTRDEERKDAEEADRRYEEAVAALRARTNADRERFHLVFEENKEYGFRRNTLGIRPIGSLLALVVFSASVVLLIVDSGSPAPRFGRWGASAVVAVILLIFWRRFVTEEWVRRAAGVYADRLFDAVHLLRPGG